MSDYIFFHKPADDASAIGARELVPDFSGAFPDAARRLETAFILEECKDLAGRAASEAVDACKAAEWAAFFHPGNRIRGEEYKRYADFPEAEFGTPERAAGWDAVHDLLGECPREHLPYREGFQDALRSAAAANRTLAKTEKAAAAAKAVCKAFRKTSRKP